MTARIGSLRYRAASYYPYTSRRAMNTAKREADRQVAAARSDGRLQRKPCVRCGRVRAVEAHHEDYARPLEVVWLCRFHHRLRHADLRDLALSQIPQTSAAAARIATIKTLPPPEPVSARVLRTNRLFLTSTPSAGALILNATLSIADAMDAEHVNEAELSRRTGSSRQAVNEQIARGVRTLSALATLADVLGYDVHVNLVKRVVAVAA